jgi:TP901 family phage tail tape measure protein
MANLGSATFQIDLDDSKLVAGLAKALAAVKASGAEMIAAYEQAGAKAGAAAAEKIEQGVKAPAAAAGTGTGQAFGSNFGKGIETPIISAGKGIEKKLGAALKSVGQGIGQSVGLRIANGIQGALGKIGGAAIDTKNLADFDAAARKANTLSSDMGALKEGAFALAKELGNTTTAAKVLDSSYDVLSSGFSKTSDVLLILKAAQIGAVGGFDEINSVANATTSVINAYGLAAKDAASIVQQMAGTQNAGKLTIAEYAANIGKLASTAAQAGVPLEQINGIISVATAKGVRVSSAFDGVRAAISAVLKPTRDAEKVAHRLGIGFDAATLKSKGLVGIIEDLSKKGAATPENLIQLFGSVEALSAIAPIAGAGLKDYAKALETIKGTSAEDAFKKVAEGITKQQEALKNRGIDLDVKIKTGAIGEALGAGLKIANQAMDGLIATTERLNNAYANLSPQQQAIARTIGGIGVAAIGAAIGVATLGTAAALTGKAFGIGSALVSGFARSIVSVAIAAAPIALPLAAAGAAAYALAKAFGATDTQAFITSMAAVGAGLAVVFGPALVSTVAAGAAALVAGFATIGTAAAAALIPLLPWIAGALAIAAALYLLKKAYEDNKEAIDDFAKGVAKGFSDAWDKIKAFATGVINALAPVAKWIGEYLSNSFNLAGGLVSRFVQNFIAGFRFLAAPVEGAARGIAASINWLADRAKQAFSLIGDAARWLGKKIEEFRNSSIRSMQESQRAITGAIDKARKDFPLLDSAIRLVQGQLKLFGDVAKSAFNSAKSAAEWFVTGTMSNLGKIGDLLNSIGRGFTELPSKIQGAAKFITGQGGEAKPAEAKPADSPAPLSYQQPSRQQKMPADSGFVLVASAGDLSGLGIGKALSKNIASAPISAGAVIVNASQYRPGGGGMEGPELDARGRRLTDQDKAVAIPGLHMKEGLPYGTIVTVTNPRNGRSTTATVRDTGPLAPGRELDITGAVARAIGFEGLGTLQVEIVKLPPNANKDQTYHFGRSKDFNTRSNAWTRSVEPGTAIKMGAAASPQAATRKVNWLASPIQGLKYEELLSYIPRSRQYGRIQEFAANRRGKRGGHQGVDYDAAVGTGLGSPVFAPFAGVATASRSARWGTTVIIRTELNGKKYEARNLHLDDATLSLYNGKPKKIEAGERIGNVGDFGRIDGHGRATGNRSHLHLEGRVDGRLLSNQAFFAQARKDMEGGNSTSAGSPSGAAAGSQKASGNPWDKEVAAIESILQSLQSQASLANKKLENSQGPLDSIETLKASNMELLAREAKGLKPRINALRKLYGGSHLGSKAIDSLDASVEDAIKGSNDATAGRRAAVADDHLKRVAQLLAERDRSREQIDNRVKISGPDQLTSEQAERQKALNDLMLLDRMNAIKDSLIKYRDQNQGVPGFAATEQAIALELGKIQKFRADTIAADRSSQADGIQSEINKLIAKRESEVSEINYRRSAGDIATDLEAQEKIADAWARSSKELSALNPLLAQYRQQWKEDTQAQTMANAIDRQLLGIETESRNLQRSALAAAAAERVDTIKKQLEARSSSSEGQIRNARYQVSTGAITAAAAEARILEIRKQESVEIERQITALTELRSIETNPAVLASIDELVGKYREIAEAQEEAAATAKKADYEASVLGQSTRGLTTELDSGFRAIFLSAGKGFRDLGGIIDGMLGKIADIGLNALFDVILGGGGAAKSGGGLLSFIGPLLGLKDGGTIKNYSIGGTIGKAAGGSIRAALGVASAYAKAMRREGAGAVPLVAKVGEEILNIREAKLYRTALADGSWNEIRRIHNYASGGEISPAGGIRQSPARGPASASSAKPSVRVSEINGVQYVSVAQLQDILEIELPRAAQAGSALTEQNLTRTSWRQSYGL